LMFEYKGVKVYWLGHDTFILEHGKRVCIDPFKLKKPVQADMVLVTHEHYDHWDMDSLKKIITPSTTLVTIKANAADASKLGAKQVTIVKPGDKKEVDGVTIEAVPAYNLTKFREPGRVFHPKEDGKVGYIVTIGGVRFYHAGDTDVIPEMSNFKTDVALLPVSGTYVMTADEAVEAARMIKPALVIPMHYGAGIGSEADAQRFKSKAPCPVEILKQE
jgi:L-ascorbate metabolism protein UlaG (beta-lactamase superfamily)